MTNEEGLTLKVGDMVTLSFRNVIWIGMVVEAPHLHRNSSVSVLVRREGINKHGRRYAPSQRHPAHLTLTGAYDATTANVFADWLDEQGESQAAAKLRAAFPICTREAK